MNVLAFQFREQPPAKHPRGEVIEFPLRRVVYESTMRPVNPVAALCGAAVAILGTMFLVVASYLVAS